MTVDRFITKTQGYYGEYSAEQRQTVVTWLRARTEREVDIIYAEVLKILSATYRTPPGIKELEEAYTRALNNRRSELGPVESGLPQIESDTTEEPCTAEEAEYYFAELKKRMRAIGRKWRETDDKRSTES